MNQGTRIRKPFRFCTIQLFTKLHPQQISVPMSRKSHETCLTFCTTPLHLASLPRLVSVVLGKFHFLHIMKLFASQLALPHTWVFKHPRHPWSDVIVSIHLLPCHTFHQPLIVSIVTKSQTRLQCRTNNYILKCKGRDAYVRSGIYSLQSTFGTTDMPLWLRWAPIMGKSFLLQLTWKKNLLEVSLSNIYVYIIINVRVLTWEFPNTIQV